jgi:multiple sugar transport system permease protein
LALCVSAFFFLPTLWLITTSIKPADEWVHAPPIWFTSDPTLDNYSDMWTDRGRTALQNSLIVSLASMVVTMLISIPAAYSMSRFNTGGRNLASYFLSLRFVPPIAFAVPYLIMLDQLQLLDRLSALVLLYLVFNVPLAIWLLKGAFDTVPRELDEAALIDCRSRLKILWRIVIPVAIPGIIAAALLVYFFSWTEYLFALLVYRTNALTVPLRLSLYYQSTGSLEWGPQAALSVAALVPILVLAVIAQFFLVRFRADE